MPRTIAAILRNGKLEVTKGGRDVSDGYLVLENAGGRVLAPDWAAVASLHRKIAAVIGAIGTVPKDKRNEFHKYDYASHDAVSDAVSSALAGEGLAFSVTIASLTQEPLGKGTHVLAELEATFMDGETGAMKILRWYGEASDTGDKAVAKACTSGVKFLLARNLLISTGDADAENGQGEAPTTKKQVGRPQKPATKQEAGNGSRPWPAEKVLAHMRGKADKLGRKDASKRQRDTLVRCLEALFMDDDKGVRAAKRHALTLQFCGIESSKDDELLSAHCRVLIGWSIIGGDGDDKWEPNPIAAKEAAAIVKLYEAERGQADMFAQDEAALDEAEEAVQALPGHASDGREIPY